MISTRSGKRGVIEIYPKFIIKKSNDLMIRGGDFYAIWIDERGISLQKPFVSDVTPKLSMTHSDMSSSPSGKCSKPIKSEN